MLAMWPTLVGHAFDIVVVIAAARAAVSTSLERRVTLVAASVVSFMMYVGALFNLSAFLAGLAALVPRLRITVAMALTIGLSLSLGWLYKPFMVERSTP